MAHLLRFTDGTVGITHCADEARCGLAKTLTELSRLGAAHIRDITVAEIPVEREFRDAWDDIALTVEVDMPKARAIHLTRIRSARDQELKAQDVEVIKAMEKGDTVEQARIVTLKQTLRDIPQSFDLTRATTPNSLSALWPPELPARTP